ncbi:MAG: hypothetical protein FJ207_06735 [Gemmatimonadetes bacterium]|nr:hypothetical protein [Gemmatimonadota bacterium]
MSLFIAWPWLALAPAAVFLLLHRSSGNKRALVAALAWGAYAVYEYGMKQRWLCTGECNIRVDLLLLYPMLLGLSLVGLVGVVRARRENDGRAERRDQDAS